MDRFPIKDPRPGTSSLCPDIKDFCKEGVAKYGVNTPRGMCRSKSCCEIKNSRFPPRVLSSRIAAISTSDFRSKSQTNLHSDRTFPDNTVRERHQEPTLARRCLSSYTAARRRNLSDSNAGKKTVTSSVRENHKGASNLDSLTENRKQQTTSSPRNSQGEYSIDDSSSLISRNEQRGQSSPNIKIAITNVLARTTTSQSSFNRPESAKKSSTTIGLSAECKINKRFLTCKDSFPCFLKTSAIYDGVSASNEINLAVSQKTSTSFEDKNATAGSKHIGEYSELPPTLRSFSLYDNLQKHLSPCKQLLYTLNKRSKQQKQFDEDSELNKPSVGVPSRRASSYVKRDALLPLRSHKLSSSKESSFVATHNPYYIFLPEFNKSRAERMCEKIKNRCMNNNDSRMISSVLSSEIQNICSKTTSFSSENSSQAAINALMQISHNSSNPRISHSFANCFTYFNRSKGNLYKPERVQPYPYFNVLRAISCMRKDARLLKSNKSKFNSLLSEVKTVPSHICHADYSESSEGQRHSGTPLPVYDIIAKKVSSGVLYQTTRKQNTTFKDECKEKQHGNKFCELSMNGRIINHRREANTPDIWAEKQMHQLHPRDVCTYKHQRGGRYQQPREKTQTVQTVFACPSCKSFNDAKSIDSNGWQTRNGDKHYPEEHLEVYDQQSEPKFSGLRPSSDFLNRRNISSNLTFAPRDINHPRRPLREQACLSSNLGHSQTEIQYVGFPCASSSGTRNDRSESVIVQSQLLERRVPSMSLLTNRKHENETSFLSSVLTERMDFQITKDVPEVHKVSEDRPDTTQEMLTATRRDFRANVLTASAGLTAPWEPELPRPTSAAELTAKPGPRRGASPKLGSKQNGEKSKHSRPRADRSYMLELQEREKTNRGETTQQSGRINDQSGNKGESLIYPEGKSDLREIKLQECSKRVVDDCPLVLVSWDESANRNIQVQPEYVQGKRSYSLLYWNNTPRETKCIRQNFTNLVKRIMSSLSSSVIQINNSLASEITRSHSAPPSSPSTKQISGLRTCSNIKQSSENRIKISETGNIICAHSVNDVRPLMQDEYITGVKSYLPEKNNFSSNNQSQNKKSQMSNESYRIQLEAIASTFNQKKVVNSLRNGSAYFIKELLFHPLEALREKEWEVCPRISSVLPVLNAGENLFTQQQEKNNEGKVLDGSLPSHKKQEMPPSSTSEWRMCIEYPTLSRKRAYTWWKGKQMSVNTCGKLFDSMGMCYMASSDDESSPDDGDVISWNE